MYTPAKSTTARILARPLRLLTFLLTLFILAISAYHIHNLRPNISGTLYAVTILSALTVLLLLISSFLSSILLAIITDLTLSAFSIAISILLRNVAQQKCAGQIDCYLDTTAFSAAIANAIFFALLALLDASIYRDYHRNRAFGLGPNNGYSTTSTRRRRGGWGSTDSEMTEPSAANRKYHMRSVYHAPPGGVELEEVGVYRDPTVRGRFEPALVVGGYVPHDQEYRAY